MEGSQEMELADGEDFVKDEFYESIQAPKWLDFDLPEEPVDDHEWFCKRAGCTDEKKPFCREQPGNSNVIKFHTQAASNALQTIPEEMPMKQLGCTRLPKAGSPIVVPTFGQWSGINCDSFSYSLFTIFFCCFP